MVERYKQLMADNDGKVHRLEDWGRRQLSYPINKIHKAHYVMMNVECSAKVLEELTNLFRFNDAVLRNLIIKRTEAITEESFILKGERENKERRDRVEQKRKVEEESAVELSDEKPSQSEVESVTDEDVSSDTAPESITEKDEGGELTQTSEAQESDASGSIAAEEESEG
jgi:small subunit ribosomal protein S6